MPVSVQKVDIRSVNHLGGNTWTLEKPENTSENTSGNVANTFDWSWEKSDTDSYKTHWQLTITPKNSPAVTLELPDYISEVQVLLTDSDQDNQIDDLVVFFPASLVQSALVIANASASKCSTSSLSIATYQPQESGELTTGDSITVTCQ